MGLFATSGIALPKLREPKRPAPSITPNEASVVVHVEVGQESIILGADLEQVADERKGWKAIILADNCPGGKATVFKIPHHGSITAHNDDVWQDKLVSNALAIATPWSLAGHSLPTESDRSRIGALTPAAFLTSRLIANPAPRRPKPVEKQLHEEHKKIRKIPFGRGAIRLRTAPKNHPQSVWGIELFGTASLIKT